MYKHLGSEHVLLEGCWCSCRQYLANSSFSTPTPHTPALFHLAAAWRQSGKGQQRTRVGFGVCQPSCWPRAGGTGMPHCPPLAPTRPGEHFQGTNRNAAGCRSLRIWL